MARVLGTKGTDVASATTLTLSGVGNYFQVTGSTGPITGITTAGWQSGATVILYFVSTPTITNNGSPAAGASKLLTSTGADVTVSAGNVIQFTLDTSLSAWQQTAGANAGGGAGSLAATLVVGNVTGGTSIVVSNGDLVRGVDAATGLPLALRGGNSSGGGAAGAQASLTGGNGDAAGAGGVALVQGGDGGATAGTGAGANLFAGNGGTGNSAGGIAYVAGGAARGAFAGAGQGAGGAVQIFGGTGGNGGASVGGGISIVGGTSWSGSGGAVSALGGTAAGAAGAGGAFTAGGGDSLGAARGGDVTLQAGTGGPSAGPGGLLHVYAGHGGTGNSDGGALDVYAGNARGFFAGTSTGNGGALILSGGYGGNGGTSTGGSVSVLGGQNWSGVGGAASLAGGGGSGNNHAGGAASIAGGAGGISNGNGGSVSISGGAADGAGTSGSVTLTAPTAGTDGDISFVARGQSYTYNDVSNASFTGAASAATSIVGAINTVASNGPPMSSKSTQFQASGVSITSAIAGGVLSANGDCLMIEAWGDGVATETLSLSVFGTTVLSAVAAGTSAYWIRAALIRTSSGNVDVIADFIGVTLAPTRTAVAADNGNVVSTSGTTGVARGQIVYKVPDA